MTAVLSRPDLVDYECLLNQTIDADFLTAVDAADEQGRFSRDVLVRIAKAGVFRENWSDLAKPDVAKLIMLFEKLGSQGSGSFSVGLGVHNSVIALLGRFGKSDYLKQLAQRAIDGDAVLCLGASEAVGGSDLQSVESTAEKTRHGYRVRGTKKYVSLSTVADAIVVVVRVADGALSTGNVALFALESKDVTIGKPYSKLGVHSLDTAPIEFDVEVGADSMIARPGTGLAAFSWCIAIERLAVAAQVVGACDLALGVTVAQMMRRRQFGKILFDHQALRLRFADLYARVDVLRYALQGLAATGVMPSVRTASGFKVTAARLGNEVADECLHVFGGAGYLDGEAPAQKWWRDMKLFRVGGGADEILWELVASGMQPNDEAYERLVNIT